MDFSLLDTFLLAFGAMGIGIVMLICGGNWIVDASVFIADRFGVSRAIVGFTVVATGTSLPELVVSIFANLQGSGGLALGNVLGSNIANILLVVGLTACFIPLTVKSKDVLRDGIMMLICTALLAGSLLYIGTFSQLMGFAMFAFLLIYIGYNCILALKGETQIEEDIDEHLKRFDKPWMPYLYLIGGIVVIALGAEFLVRGASVSAEALGVPEDVVGLSVVALGTSLPELSTCIISARRGMYDLVFGNVLGSNVFNILMIIGITALIKPIGAESYSPQLADFDIWVTLGAALIFFLIVALFKHVPRFVGVLFTLAYLGYIGYIYAIYI